MTGFSIAVDIGGTFTDVVLRHRDGRFWVDKTLSTPADPKQGFFAAIDAVLKRGDCRPELVDDVVVHATTIVTNAIIERKAPTCAMIVTEGFRDLLAIRDECRSDAFDNQLEVPEALIPHELTFGVPERTLSDGSIAREVDVEAVRALTKSLRDKNVVSVAVCFLNAYKNAHNERQVRDILLEEMPDLFVSLSGEVAPQMREYPRASTTALNAYTVPIVKPYFKGLVEGLRAMGFGQELLIMLSSGGVIGAEIAGDNPVRMIESGPAAGALAASFYARTLQLPDLISFDMGGTTAKACFIQDFKPLVTNAFEVDRIYRFQPGSGLPVTVPCIDMIEIGAGGGSIAGVDGLGMMTVGPQSAGSTPGPVCYGRGGDRPTVTDADLTLGMLDGDNFLGGEVRLDVEAARDTLARYGATLDLDVDRTALGIYELVSEAMAAAVRAHATDRGVDWRGVPMLAFGGAGPVHACRVAELIDSKTVIFPPMASVLSAFGALVTPIRLDLFRSDLGQLDQLDWEAANNHVSEMIDEATSALLKAGCRQEAIQTRIRADIRYKGQYAELPVIVEPETVEKADFATIAAEFEEQYRKVYAINLSGLPLEVVSWRVTAIGTGEDAPKVRSTVASGSDGVRYRPVVFRDGVVETPVYSRTSLKAGAELTGPVLIEERETTIVILPNWKISVDEHGCIFANREERKVGHHPSSRALESSDQHI